MASLIPGYEYDIFISYRQKDNKGDKWVSEFVDALKTELEATFKEEVSVYFDINPHDGLLETHDVDASLKEKLKCLVFIPIISRTYCDPKSFAWEHEFKVFVEQASKDKYGLKVKLSGGNVTKRILPVQIHDLNVEDRKLVEDELGAYLRGIEFIYKEPGVNRPLRANEDHPDNNLNKTFYRNQINKVANAINEIIDSLKHLDNTGKGIPENIVEEKPLTKKTLNTKIITGSILLLILIVAGYFIIPKQIKPKEQPEKSIAVLPFKLLSDEPDKQYLADGMMEAILLNLSKIKDLRVMSSTSVEQYRGTTKTTRQIGKELGVGYLLEGRFQKDGDKVRLIVQLIKASEESHAWADEYDRNWKEVFSVQSEVAQTIASELHVAISPEAKQLIEKKPTTNLTAYDNYQRGREEYTKYLIDNSNIAALDKAENLFHTALKYDSAFAKAYTGLAGVYWGKYYYKEYFSEHFLDSALLLANMALSFDEQLSEAHYMRGGYYVQKGFRKQALEEFDKTLKLNPNDWMAFFGKGELYSIDDYLSAIENLQMAASLNHGSELPLILVSMGLSYYNAGFIEKTKDIALEFFKLVGDSTQYLGYLAQIEYFQSNYEQALEFLGKGYARDTTNVDILAALGFCYSHLERFKESLKYYKKYIERKNALGQFDLDGTQRIGYSYWKNGYTKIADDYFDKQIEYCKNSIQNSRPYAVSKKAYYDLAGVYAFRGNKEKAYEYLRIFNQRQMMESFRGTFMQDDPLFDSIRNESEFQKIVRDIESKYQAEHERVRKWLEENNML